MDEDLEQQGEGQVEIYMRNFRKKNWWFGNLWFEEATQCLQSFRAATFWNGRPMSKMKLYMLRRSKTEA